MKRRDFLVGAAGAVAAGSHGFSGISPIVVPTGASVSSAEMDTFLTSLDRAMDHIAVDPNGGRFVRALQEGVPDEGEDRLFRQSMRSLLLVGNFGDLPLQGQVHPGMQRRLRYSAPEMDASLFGIIEKVKTLDSETRGRIKTALNHDPSLAERVIEAIDLEAASVGVPVRRRLQLRVMGKHIVRRLKQSQDLLIDEYVVKCEKMTARPVTPLETHRLMATQMGEEAFQERLRKIEDAARRWEDLNPPGEPIGYRLLQDDEQSDKWYRTGLRMLGIGAATTAVGWLLIGISNEGGPLMGPGVVLGVTIGPITIALGLVTLLLGGLIDLTDGP